MSDLGLSGSIARFDSYHGRQEGGGGALRYPSPFFDIGHTYLPTSIKQMFRWCRYYFLTNPLINSVTYKMAEYPITDIIVDDEDSEQRGKWEEAIEHQLKVRTIEIEAGLDYFCYGIAFLSLYFPFEKYLICPNCKAEYKAKDKRTEYKFRNLKYFLACSKCQMVVEAKVKDVNIKNFKGIRVIRWNPEYVTAEHNDITGETAYFFDIPMATRNDIIMGKRHVIESIPDVFIESLRTNKSLRMTADNMFVLKRPTIAQKDMGWGMPLILPVLKDTFYLQILRKGQEAIAQQHIVPLRILFPQAGGSDASPYSTTDLGMWRKRIDQEIQKWRVDPNYIPVLPLPVGQETVGGEGKALMLHQEMRAWSEQIVAGMHVPIEFVFGGLQYSGSNVSMRMLENQFLGYRTNLLIMVRDFILGKIADYMGWNRPKVHFKRFKMADDLQRLQLTFQMNQAQKVSDTTLLDEADLDIVQEEKHKAAEMSKQMDNQRKQIMAQAELQGEQLMITTRYQIQAQKLMQAAGVPPPQPGGGAGAGAGGGGGDQMGDMMKQFGEQVGAAGPPGQQDQQPDQGEEAAPGMPAGVKSYPEKGGTMPNEGIPMEMQSPLSKAVGQGAQYSPLYLARRAATHLENLDEMTKNIELLKMKGKNPQLYGLTLQLLQDAKGSQTDPLNPGQSPLPEIKPPRRKNALI
jgi:hypothetical protein